MTYCDLGLVVLSQFVGLWLVTHSWEARCDASSSPLCDSQRLLEIMTPTEDTDECSGRAATTHNKTI